MAKRKYYWVDWYRNGYCYRSTSMVPWSGVLECKKTAKVLGEKITYEVMDIK